MQILRALAFSAQAMEQGVSAKHFRKIHGLVLSSLGMGTYLGSADGATD
ncbi:MAG: hypothetical protein ACYC7D_11835 [Nitrososphaerales archaeon]